MARPSSYVLTPGLGPVVEGGSAVNTCVLLGGGHSQRGQRQALGTAALYESPGALLELCILAQLPAVLMEACAPQEWSRSCPGGLQAACCVLHFSPCSRDESLGLT